MQFKGFLRLSAIFLAGFVLLSAALLALGMFEPTEQDRTWLASLTLVSGLMYVASLVVVGQQTRHWLVLMLSLACTLSLTENALHASQGGKLVSIACLVQFDNLYYRFTTMSDRLKVLNFAYKVAYVHWRLNSGSEGPKVTLRDAAPIAAFAAVFVCTTFVDAQVSKFICDTFKRLEETKDRWFACLQNLPSGVIVYDR